MDRTTWILILGFFAAVHCIVFSFIGKELESHIYAATVILLCAHFGEKQ